MHKQHILISLEPRHAQNILSGRKSVELRRRSVKVEPGDIIWIYSKRPCAAIVGWAEVFAVRSASPQSIWRRHGVQAAVTREEFFDYFNGRSIAYAIELRCVNRLENQLSLETLRATEMNFCPPQFFKKLHQESRFFGELTAAANG